MTDTNIYSSSAFIKLVRHKHDLDLMDISRITGNRISNIKNMLAGREQLGRDNYFKIIEHIGEDIQCDYMGEYNASKRI